jgi:hypothetical protein
MSLPSVLGTTVETVPCDVPYLRAKSDLVEKWRDRIRALGKVVVGIAWQGNRKYQADHLRSLPLSHFVPLAGIEGVALVSLQKNDGSDQLEQHREAIHHFTDELDRTEPFADTAAIIDCLDLVITCDTAIGHLAGAMGKPVWTVLTYSSDWRWLDANETSAWYPNTRLFRQQSYLDWSGVFERVAAELKLVAAGDRARLTPPHRAPAKSLVETPISIGELLDKLTILDIKAERISDSAKLANVRREADLLRAIVSQRYPQYLSHELVEELRRVNAALWEVEDRLRELERRQEFQAEFVELARSVYFRNDERAQLKRRINDEAGSVIVEEKSYIEYR